MVLSRSWLEIRWRSLRVDQARIIRTIVRLAGEPSAQPAAEAGVDLFDNWFDSLEAELRPQARSFEEPIRDELDAVLAWRGRMTRNAAKQALQVTATAAGSGGR